MPNLIPPDTSLFFLGDQLPEATGHSIGFSGLMKCKHSFICFLTPHSKHLQLYKWKGNTAIQQHLLPPLNSVRKARPHFDVTVTQHGCCGDVWEFLVALLSPLSCILSGKVKPAWLGDIYRWNLWSNWGKKWGFFSTGILSFCPRWPSWAGSLNFVLCHRRAADDATLASIKEQKAFQCSRHVPQAMSTWFNFFEGEF